MHSLEVEGLDVVLTGGNDREGGGDGPLVVLLHGFGAPADDLVPLHRVLDVPRAVRFAFPAAPLVPPEFAAFGGRAWWPIDVAAVQAEMASGARPDRSRDRPEGMLRARDQLEAVLDGLQRRLGVGGEAVVLGGFSQGAMLSCELALCSARPLAGLALLSTTLLSRDVWQPRMASRAELPILMAHGRNDPLLPFATAVELRELLRAAGCSVTWVEHNGGHEITSSALLALSTLIRTACPDS